MLGFCRGLGECVFFLQMINGVIPCVYHVQSASELCVRRFAMPVNFSQFRALTLRGLSYSVVDTPATLLRS